MSDKQGNLTDEEIEDLQGIVTDTLASICTMADKHNIDRDSMLKCFTEMLTAFTEVASIQNYETNEHTNADRIRNMSDEELADSLTATAKCDECFVIKEHEPYCLSASACRQKHLEWLQSEAE